MTTETSDTALLEDLLTDPPQDEAEVRERLSPAELQSVQEQLVTRLETLEPSTAERSLAGLLLSVDAAAWKERLTTVALDQRRPRLVRATSLLILADSAPEIFQRLAPEDATLPVEASIEELLEHAADAPEAVREIAELFAAAPSTARPFLVQTLLRMSEAQGLPVEPLLEPLLKKKALAAQKPSLVEALAQDAGARGAELLETMAKRNKTEGYGEAAQRIRKRLAETPIPEGTEAWALPCDGSGTFQVLIATAGTERTLAGVLGHVTQGLVDGLFFPRLTQEQLDTLLEGVRSQLQIPVAEIAPADAAAMLAELARHTRDVPWGAQMALATAGHFETTPFTPPAPAAHLDESAVEALLARPMFESWLIDPVDLAELPPPAGPERDAWVTEMMANVDDDARALLARMARHDAWWFQACGNVDAAGQLAAAADQVEKAPGHPILLRVMLEATARAIDELPVDDAPTP